MVKAAPGARHFLYHFPVELGAAAVLSAAGVLSSWCGYQASLWDGAQFARYETAGASRLKASEATLEASMTRSVEVAVFRAWVEAKMQGDAKLASFYQARFPPDLRAAFPEWLAERPFDDPHAAPTPFAMATYRPQGRSEAAALERKAEQEFRTALAAKHAADAYSRAAVVLATAMFFAGIGQAFTRRGVRLGLVALAILVLMIGAAQMFSLPILFLGRH